MSNTQRHLSAWFLLALGLISFPRRVAGADASRVVRGLRARSTLSVASLSTGTAENAQIPYSEFVEHVNRHQISSVVISGQSIQGVMRDGSFFSTVSPGTNHTTVVDALIRDNVRITGEAPAYLSPEDLIKGLGSMLNAVLPMLLLIAAWWYLNRRSHDTPGTPDLTRMRRSPAQHVAPGEVKVRLSDVAGIDEAKQEVAEIVDYLRTPAKYAALGAKIPRGVLLVGPPGTGKTLLARAIAGEAGVPFFSNSGSAFVELYVGVGAARVRNLFAQARLCAPCIVFIDEIDAVGGHRVNGAGANGEREQTLNQLLVAMDGFSGNEGIIVIAATNRPDCLDAALLRPGRFDRRIVVPLPDVRGREEIIRVHLRSVPLAQDVSTATIARAAVGFSGAELANLINEAALLAARDGAHEVGWKYFERALDKLMLGLERRTMQPTEAERRTTAYHEAGHALVSLNVPDHDPVRKITIVPHGRSLGATAHLPIAERSSLTRQALESRLCALLGGRAAEELIFGPDRVTTAAADDLERANELACRMVAQYGFCEALGPVCYLRAEEAADAGAAMTRDLSPETASAVERAQRALIEASHTRALAILTARADALHALAAALLRSDTLDAAQIRAIVDRRSVRRCPKKNSRHDTRCSRTFKQIASLYPLHAL